MLTLFSTNSEEIFCSIKNISQTDLTGPFIIGAKINFILYSNCKLSTDDMGSLWSDAGLNPEICI
jgi:hypothetical protein